MRRLSLEGSRDTTQPVVLDSSFILHQVANCYAHTAQTAYLTNCGVPDSSVRGVHLSHEVSESG